MSPDEFHFWSAVTIIAASLKRHVFIDRGWKLYPNLYTVLVGRQAVGKGASIDPAQFILTEANTANTMTDRLTIEYVEETLAIGFPVTAVIPGGQIAVGREHNAIVIAPELSVFLRKNTSDALVDLTRLWDSPPKFDYGTRGKGLKIIKDVCLSILGGSTTTWLTKSIPNDAIGGGFTRRVNFVYTKNDPVLPRWNLIPNGAHKNISLLIDDLRHIHNLRGQFTATKEFEKLFDEFTQGTQFDDFDDEVKTSYKASKWVNALKVSMVLSISRGDSLVLEKPYLEEAIIRVNKVEDDLGMVFRTTGESTDAAAMGHILNFLEKRGKATLSEIMRISWRHASKEDTIRILSTLTGAHLVGEGHSGSAVIYTFVKNP